MSQPNQDLNTPFQVDLKNPWKAALLAWLIPGWGHFYQGRTAKGVIYLVSILGLFFSGWFLGAFSNVYWDWSSLKEHPENLRFPFLAQIFVGLASAPALIQATFKSMGMAPLLGSLMIQPDLEVLNQLQTQKGRVIEIGTIYTIVAGLLNILAIFDAFGGPAYHALANSTTNDQVKDIAGEPVSPPAPTPTPTPAAIAQGPQNPELASASAPVLATNQTENQLDAPTPVSASEKVS